jgi:hypothetical protein
MNDKQRNSMIRQASKLADLLVQAKPGQIKFQSEREFLEMLGLQPSVLPVRVKIRPD